MKLIKSIAVLCILGLAGQASADTISGLSDPTNNEANFTWQINDKGFLVITVANTSQFSGVITGMRFDLDGGGTIDHMVDVDGTAGDGAWHYTDAGNNCAGLDCVLTGGGLRRGNTLYGLQAGTTASFRFVGDFTGLESISNVLVRFQDTGRRGNNNDSGTGCAEGCNARVSSVPEPGMLVLFGTGLMGVGVAWRRRQKAAA